MLTSVQPWSGHFEVNPVVWATAHLTQFTKAGWKYLGVGSGSGKLPNGGYYTTIVDPNGQDFTINVVKISQEHAHCTRPGLPNFVVEEETVTFALDANLGAPASLAVWYSNYNTDSGSGVATLFEKRQDVAVVKGKFSLHVPVGAHFTVSTVRTAQKMIPEAIPASVPSFPLPYTDDFQSKPISQEAPLLADQIGAFEVHFESHGGVEGSAGNKVMKQMVPQLPIGWSDSGTNGPMTLIGMREWQDISLSVDFKLPPTAHASAAGCVATRVDQMWLNGIVFCLASTGSWNLTVGGPQLGKGPRDGQLIVGGRLPQAPGLDKWVTVELSTVDSKASVSVNGAFVLQGQAIRNIDTGFGAIGANDWFAIEYDNLSIKQVGSDWHPTSPCGAAKVGDPIVARNCSSNGVAVSDLMWELDPNWMLRHVPSGLCATASGNATGSTLSLQKCVLGDDLQKYTNDYTRIRNTVMPLMLHNSFSRALFGRTDGSVFVHGTRCTDPSTYKYTGVYNGTRCEGLRLRVGGHASPQACALLSCNANAEGWQWHEYENKTGGDCYCGTAKSCSKDPAWVGASWKQDSEWDRWSFFPNTGQLRNQYIANTKLGYPMCLTTCST